MGSTYGGIAKGESTAGMAEDSYDPDDAYIASIPKLSGRINNGASGGGVKKPTAERVNSRPGGAKESSRTPKPSSRITGTSGSTGKSLGVFKQLIGRKSTATVSSVRNVLNQVNIDKYKKVRKETLVKARKHNLESLKKVISNDSRCESINNGKAIRTWANRASWDEFDVSMGVDEEGIVDFKHLTKMLAYAEISTPEVIEALANYQLQESIITLAEKSSMSNEDMQLMVSPVKGKKLSTVGQTILLAEIQKDEMQMNMMNHYAKAKAEFAANNLDVGTADGLVDAARGATVAGGLMYGATKLGIDAIAAGLLSNPVGWAIIGIASIVGVVSAFWRSASDVESDQKKIQSHINAYKQQAIPAMLVNLTEDAIRAQTVDKFELTEADLQKDGYSYFEYDKDGVTKTALSDLKGLPPLEDGYTYIYHKDTGTAVATLDMRIEVPLAANAKPEAKEKRKKKKEKKAKVVKVIAEASKNLEKTVAAILPIRNFYLDEGSQAIGLKRQNNTLHSDNPFNSDGGYKQSTVDQLRAANLGIVNNTQNLSLGDGLEKAQDGVATVVNTTLDAASSTWGLLKYLPHAVALYFGYKIIKGASNGKQKDTKSVKPSVNSSIVGDKQEPINKPIKGKENAGFDRVSKEDLSGNSKGSELKG